MRTSGLAVALVTVLGVLGGCRGDAKECDDACRNGFTLSYWAKQDIEINAAPVAQRDLLRRRKLAALDAELARGIDLCVSQCVSANDRERAKCMIKATTADQFHACMPAD